MARYPNGADYGAKVDAGIARAVEHANPRLTFLEMYPWLRAGVVYVEDDFTEDTLSTTRWNLATDGADASAFAWSSAENGTIAGSTGTTDNGYLAINGDVLWKGDKNCGMEVRWKIDEVTGFTFEIGWTDALTDETLPAVTDVDTPATGNGAVDVAVIHLDTDQTLTTAAFVSESTTTSYAAQKVNIGTWTPTAATYYKSRVQLLGDNALYKIWNDTDPANPVLIASGEGGLSLAIEGATLVRPHILFGTRNTTAKAPIIDLIRVWKDR